LNGPNILVGKFRYEWFSHRIFLFAEYKTLHLQSFFEGILCLKMPQTPMDKGK